MAASTAPAAKSRLLVLFAAQAGLAGVSKDWSAPSEGEDLPKSGEMLYFGDVSLTGSWRLLGAAKRDEDYTLALTIWVQQDGDDMRATEERSWAILDLVSAAIQTDRTLQDLLMSPAEIASATQRVGVAGADKTGSRIDALIRCVARFTP
jgi:hypothetical protein